MGALPKRKISKARRGRRCSHLALKTTRLVACPQCHELRLPHHMCPSCGHYKGTEVIAIESKSAKKE
jgi:large subunit ribosomal protein L32